MGLLLFPTTTKNLRRMWAFPNILLLSIQINGSSIYQYVWSWTINYDFSFEFVYFIDSLNSIILFNTSMLGLVTIGMCSYLLIGFWFTRSAAANTCNFGLLLGILGFYWITGIAKSAQFPLHVWLPNAMEGPTSILALIHVATMVVEGIFLISRLFLLFIVIPYIVNLIFLIGIITILLGATLALAQKDIKRGFAYSTMSQLGYMMLTLGMGSYRAALFHLITHAYSKVLLFLASRSIIHSMEAIVGYSLEKSQNMFFMGGLRKHVPITKITFLVGTLSLCDEILSDSWLYSPIFAIIAWSTARLTAFYISFYSIKPWGKEEQKIINTIAIPFNQEGMHLHILSKLSTPSINLLHQNSNDFEDSDMFYSISLTKGIRGLAELTHFFDR
ncbi:hypothetical protein V6Z11_D09G056900 [Gossypium hirsutum]